jgi:hypothetical protein
VLGGAPTTERVHAAEVLIQFGFAGEVAARFLADPATLDAQPIQRVVRWRVLARSVTNRTDRERYAKQILEIATQSGAPDQLHAVESAAKIGAALSDVQRAALEKRATELPEHDAVFVHWLLWSKTPPANSAALLVKWLQSDDAITRLRAAYLLRWLKPTDQAILDALTIAADASVDANLATAIVVSSACIIEPRNPHADAWRTKLWRVVATKDSSATYHALQGLMINASREDREKFLPLLDDMNADIRVGAAWAILQSAQTGP